MKRYFQALLFLVLGLLSLGTVFKKKDAIGLTQTDPIGYQEKLKEEEEGKKGPPVPSLELFPKKRFLVEGPVEKRKEPLPVEEGMEEEGMEVEEILEGEEVPFEEEFDWDFWLEEDEEFKLESETDDTSPALEEGRKPLP